MTREEAIARIKEHMIIHKNKEPKAIYITEALDMAIQALSQEPCDDVVSREDAIKAQCEACDICGNMRYTKCQYFMQGCNEVQCLRDLSPAAQKSGKWIPVSEGLPEWDIECLVVDDKGEFGVGFYRDDVGAWDSPSWGWLERKDEVDNHDVYYMPCGIGKVIAWMPLPKPYEPQESEEV